MTLTSCFVYKNLQRYQGLIIDRCLEYLSCPQDRINTQVIYRFALAQIECKVSVLLNNCKQNNTSLSLLVGMTVATCMRKSIRMKSFCSYDSYRQPHIYSSNIHEKIYHKDFFMIVIDSPIFVLATFFRKPIRI